jgi:L-ribulokinase
MPSKSVISLGSAIFAFLAAGTFKTVEEAQDEVCPPHTLFTPEPEAQKVYSLLYPVYQKIYFGFGQPRDGKFGDILPTLINLARGGLAHGTDS